MERVIVPKGTKVNWNQLFIDLQSFTNTNLKRRYDQLISSYGVRAEVTNGVVTGTGFQVSELTSDSLTINF